MDTSTNPSAIFDFFDIYFSVTWRRSTLKTHNNTKLVHNDCKIASSDDVILIIA